MPSDPAPLPTDIPTLEAMAVEALDRLRVIRQALHTARLAAAPVKAGDIVLDRKGAKHRVVVVDASWSKPWVKANPLKKDGTYDTALRRLYNDWKHADAE